MSADSPSVDSIMLDSVLVLEMTVTLLLWMYAVLVHHLGQPPRRVVDGVAGVTVGQLLWLFSVVLCVCV